MQFVGPSNFSTSNIGSVVALFIGLVSIASIIEASYLNTYLIENVDLGITISILPMIFGLFIFFFTNAFIVLACSSFFIS